MAGDDEATFGDLVRLARRVANLSQEELAARAGLSARGISDLERGVIRTPRKDTFELIAEALNLPADERRVWERARRAFATAAPLVQPTARAVADQTTPNLPARLTSFIGREHEIVDLQVLLGRSEVRLVTVTGAGGIGKTSLATQVAAGVATTFEDGVRFVSLASVTDPALVVAAITSALGVQDRGASSTNVALVGYLSDKHVLLLLDNFEQVVDAAPLIAGLLRACPALTVLVTSRTPLRISGEWEYPLVPLSLPSLDDPTDLQMIAAAPAVTMFVERAMAVRPDFELRGDNVASVAEICHRLDGLPLAIELAAARIRAHSPALILARLGQRLAFLSGGVRDAPARQRTLRDTFRWSYDLLSVDEQRLFRVSSVFRGGWTIEAVEDITGDDVEIDVGEGMERLIERLIEHSLVRSVAQSDGDVRYAMLETIREFGLEQLTALGERDAIRGRHADYFARYFQPAPAEWRGPRVRLWLTWSEREIDNVRSALEWAVEHDADTALRLCRSFSWYWLARGPHGEAREWFDRALASPLPSHPASRAAALCRSGSIAVSQRNHAAARQLIEEGLALYRQLGGADGIAEGVYNLGRIAMMTAQFEEAVRLFEESASISKNVAWLIPSLSNLGNSRIGAGDYDGAAASLDEGLALARQHNDTSEIGFFLAQQGLLALKRGDLTSARRRFAAGIPILRDLGESRLSTHALEWCAWLAALEGKPERTAMLLGAVSQLRDTLNNPLQPRDELEYDWYVPISSASIDSSGWDGAWTLGRLMTLNDALTYALTDLQ